MTLEEMADAVASALDADSLPLQWSPEVVSRIRYAVYAREFGRSLVPHENALRFAVDLLVVDAAYMLRAWEASP